MTLREAGKQASRVPIKYNYQPNSPVSGSISINGWIPVGEFFGYCGDEDSGMQETREKKEKGMHLN